MTFLHLGLTVSLLLAASSGAEASQADGAPQESRAVRIFLPDGQPAVGTTVWVAGSAEPRRTDERGIVEARLDHLGRFENDFLVIDEQATPAYVRPRGFHFPRVALQPRRPWELRLVRRDGAPLAGATVRQLRPLRGCGVPVELMQHAQEVTRGEWQADTSGVVRLPFFHGLGLEVEVDGQRIVVPPLEFQAMVPGPVGADVRRTTLTLHEGLETAIRFLDEDDQPIVGRECRIPGWNGRFHLVETDASGWARAEGPFLTTYSTEHVDEELARPPRARAILELDDNWTYVVDLPVGTTRDWEWASAEPVWVELAESFDGMRVEAALVPAAYTTHGVGPVARRLATKWVELDRENPVVDTGILGSEASLLLLRDAESKDSLWACHVPPGRTAFYAGFRTVTVHLDFVDPEWVDDLEIALWPVSTSGASSSSAVRGDGSATLRASEGEYEVSVTPFPLVTIPGRVEIGPETDSVAVRLLGQERLERIQGTVVMADGTSAAGARVLVGRTIATCDEEGAFTLLASVTTSTPVSVELGFPDPPHLGFDGATWEFGEYGSLDFSEPLRVPEARVRFGGSLAGRRVTTPVPFWPDFPVAFQLWTNGVLSKPRGAHSLKIGGEGVPLFGAEYRALPGRYAIRLTETGRCVLLDLTGGDQVVIDETAIPADDGRDRIVVQCPLRSPDAGRILFQPERGSEILLGAVFASDHAPAELRLDLPDEPGTLIYRSHFHDEPARMQYEPRDTPRELLLRRDVPGSGLFEWSE